MTKTHPPDHRRRRRLAHYSASASVGGLLEKMGQTPQASATDLPYSRCMSLRKRLFALTYDRMSRKAEEAGLRALRQGLLADIGGRVLEIGGGTGANLPFYDGKVESLVVTEPEPAMLRRLQRKAREQASLAEVVRAPAEELPFADGTFD